MVDFRIFLVSQKFLSSQGGRKDFTDKSNCNSLYFLGYCFPWEIIYIIYHKYYATYKIAKNMIRYEQVSLYYVLELKQAFAMKKSYCKKSWIKFKVN